jgi:filamentous hemagglutinin family protein
MNARSYKTVFSKRLGALVAVGEHASSHGKANGAGSGGGDGASGTLGYIAALTASFALVSLAWAAPATNALPTAGQVVQGAASMSQAANQLTINQSTQRAAINWQSFDIGASAKVQVVQPNAQAVLLNRVVGQSPSQIFGQLQANGHVILVNPNGVLFGKDGSVNAASFTASTLGISDANFMAGNMVYERNGSTAGIVNQGSITTAPGGYVALLGASVNNEGKINTKGGNAFLAAADTIKVPVSGTGRIKLELSAADMNANVSNSGSIITEGGQVYMQALALNRAAAQIIQSGSIDTTGEQGGAVHLLVDGGKIRVNGSIKANSTGIDENGQAKAGGDIYIGRDKDTNVLAAIGDSSGANLESIGGFIETSGSFLKVDNISVKANNWLLDPSNIEIVADTVTPIDTNYPSGNNPVDYTPTATSKIKASTIAGNLNNGTNVTLSTGVDANSTTGDEGNIFVNAAIEKTGDKSAKLTLIANNRIIVKAGIGKKATPAEGDTGNLDVDLTAHGNRKTGAQGSVVMNNVIDAGKGKVTITAISQTGWEGLIFQGNSGITAGTYTVKGSSVSTAIRFNGGTATFNSSLGDSLIEGTGGGFGGVFAASGNTINLNTTGSATTTLSSGAASTAGMRFGHGGGVTVNTSGNVTIGSHNDNSGLFVQANVNVNSGHLILKGKSVGNGIGLQDGSGTPAQISVNNGSSLTMHGISSTSGNGIDLRPQGVANFINMTGMNNDQRGTLNLIGSSATGSGIFTNGATITSDGGNINLTGNSQGNGIFHDGLIRSGGSDNGGVVTLIGTSTGTTPPRLGVNLSSGTVQGGTVIVEGSTKSSAQGVYASANTNIKSVTSNVSIKGESNTGTATHLQGKVTGQTGVTIEGVTNGTTANSRSVLIENAITAATGDINVTGIINNNSDAGQRAITLVGSTSKLDAQNGNINLNTDSLFVNSAPGNNTDSMISAAGMNNGIVSINTTTAGKPAVMGAGVSDSNTQLGIDNGEFGKISANKLVIGNAARTGDITVTGATTTNSDLELQTQGNIAIAQELKVGASGDKNLTLKAGGTSVGGTGKVTANKLTIDAANAAVAMASLANQVNQLLANVKSLDFKNGKALDLQGITASGKIKIATTTGDLNLKKDVVSTTLTHDADAVILNAGSDAAAGTDTGGNIVADNGVVVSVDLGSTAKLYTGSIGGSTNMQGLAGGSGSGKYRYNSNEITKSYSKELTGKSATNNGVYVIYRKKPVVEVKVNDVTKVYDGLAHAGGSFNNTVSNGAQNGDTDALIGGNVVFGGNAQGVKNVLDSIGKKITATDSADLNALGYGVTYKDGDLKITPRPLSIAVGLVAEKKADGTTTANVTPGALGGLVPGESLGVVVTSANFSDANAGTSKVVTASYSLLDTTDGLASNYILNASTPNPDRRLRGNILASVNPVVNPTPSPVNNNTASRVRTVSGFGGTGAATGVLDDQPLSESREICSDLNPENCECQPSVIPTIEICFAPKSLAANKEEK